MIDLIEFYLNEINKLEFNSEPPYLKIMNRLTDTLKSLGHSGEDNFYAFSQSKTNLKATAQVTFISVFNFLIIENKHFHI